MKKPAPNYERIRHLLRQNRVADAEHECRKQLKKSGQIPALVSLHAQVVERQQGISAALPIHIQAAQLAERDSVIHEALATCLDRAGRASEACNVRFGQFLLGERHPVSLLALVRSLLPGRGEIKSDRTYRAIDFVRAAMEVVPRPLEAAAPFIEATWAGDEAHLARAILREVLALTPTDEEAWKSYAFLLQMQASSSAVRRALAHVIALTGDDQARILRALSIEPAHSSRAAILEERRRIDNELDELLARPSLHANIVDQLGNFVFHPFYLAYHGEDDRPLMEKMAKMFRRAVPELTWSAPHVDLPRPENRSIRVGVVGQFFTGAIVMTTMPLFMALDSERFSVNFYSIIPANSQGYQEEGNLNLKRLPWSIRQAREIIAADEIDILVYTEVFMTNLFYFLGFSRIARHQLLRPGHPVTSGLDTMDYALSAWTLERPGAQADYTETLLHLKELCTDYPRIEPEVGKVNLSDLGVPAGYNLYLCSQTWYKLHPDFDPILRRILETDPRGMLLLFENPRESGMGVVLERLLGHLGDCADRVRILPRQPLDRYMGLLGSVDVMLDTYHFCGGNTSYQSFQMGLPMITRPPPYMRGRGTASFYQIMGFDELIANSDDQYVQLAVRIATDRDYRDYCRREILARCGRLFDRVDVVREYEQLFDAMVSGADLTPWCARPTG